MTNAVAEVPGKEDSVETMLENFDLDSDNSANHFADDEFDGGASKESNDGVSVSAEALSVSENGEIVSSESENVSHDANSDSAAEPNNPGTPADAAATAAEDTDPHAAELAALRRQLDHVTSRLSEIQFADRQICEQAAKVRQLADDVQDCESAAKEAKADLTAAKERHESAVRELRSMIEDRGRGQGRLPLQVADKAASTTSPAKTAETPAVASAKTEETPQVVETVVGVVPQNSATDEFAGHPINVLHQKKMLAEFGQDAWQAAKDREEPFGMGNAEIETLETAEIETIGHLEKRMREDAWWHKKLPKFGEKKVAKLIESLRV